MADIFTILKTNYNQMKTKILLLAISCLFISNIQAQKSKKKNNAKVVTEEVKPELPRGKSLYFKADTKMDHFIDDLMLRMTLDEKIGQMIQAERENISAQDIKNYKKMLFLITIFSVFLGSSNFLFSFMLQKTLSSAIARDYYQLGFVSILFLIASAIYGVAFYYMQKYKEIINQELNLLLKSELLEQIIKIPLSQKNKFGQGNLLIMLNEDSENFATYFSNIIIPSFQLIMSMVSGSVYILLYSWQIFLLISLITVLFVIFNLLIFAKRN